MSARQKLDNTRPSVTHKFQITAKGEVVRGYITVGRYPDGSAGEVFITLDTMDPCSRGAFYAVGVMISLALQNGAPIEDLARQLAYMNFEPSGFTKNPNIRHAKSIADYIGRWLLFWNNNREEVFNNIENDDSDTSISNETSNETKEGRKEMHQPSKYYLNDQGTQLLCDCEGGPKGVKIDTTTPDHAAERQLFALLKEQREWDTGAEEALAQAQDNIAKFGHPAGAAAIKTAETEPDSLGNPPENPYPDDTTAPPPAPPAAPGETGEETGPHTNQ